MTQKQWNRMGRKELLELLADRTQELEQLKPDAIDPDSDQIRKAAAKAKSGWNSKSIIYAVLAALAILTAIGIAVTPVLQVYGDSMNPTLFEGDILICVKGAELQPGDLVAFQFSNKVLVKRAIAFGGQQVDIRGDGSVLVDGTALEEPYLADLAFGDCNIDLPFQVPEGRVFVMGDYRSLSLDSRNKQIGCVTEEQLIGKPVFCVWPLNAFGKLP